MSIRGDLARFRHENGRAARLVQTDYSRICEQNHARNRSKIKLTSLDRSDIDTVWTWGGQTSTPHISKYISDFFLQGL